MLKEAKRLHGLGFGILWLRANSKLPIEKSWTTGERKPLDYLLETYSKDMKLNMGVRLGDGSKLNDGYYLAVIDCDVKSKDETHLAEMEQKLSELLKLDAPCVMSGRGNGSKHLYIKTAQPLQPFRYSQSSQKVKVEMPSVNPNKKELEELSSDEIERGIRLRYAWEISVMGQGQQVVLPPSIHPDSRKPYKWAKSLFGVDEIPLVDIKAPQKKERDLEPLNDFQAVDVDLETTTLSERVIGMIRSGDNVDDRSAALLSVTISMLKQGFTQNEILSVLTTQDYYLGRAAYEHAKTESRKRAAEWLLKYTMKKAQAAANGERDFENVVEVFDNLSDEEAQAQSEDFGELKNWRDDLDRTQTLKLKNTLNNCTLILRHGTGVDQLLEFDEFNVTEKFLSDTPWGSKKGHTIQDHDIFKIKLWMSQNYGLEPSNDRVSEAITLLAQENTVHPVRDYLSQLKWDGTARIDTWLKDYFGAKAPEPYLSDVSRKFLVGMIARIFSPGIKFDTVLILEGKQGVGKSSVGRMLASEPWFSDAYLNIGDKDAVLNMQGTWLYELGELSAMTRSDTNQLKEFVTRTVDKIRPPYGQRVVHYPRQCVFIGTTNNDEYLKDKTGNRRYWPVSVGELNFKAFQKDREQLLAEAINVYAMGEILYLEKEQSRNQAHEEQVGRQEYDAIVETVEDLLVREFDHGSLDPECFTMKQLFAFDDGSLGKMDRQTQLRVGSALRELGFEKKVRRVDFASAKAWVPAANCRVKFSKLDLGF